MRIIAASATLLLAATVARAEPMEELSAGGRYQLMDVNEKIIRLDTETGGFDVCRMEGEEWSCQVARDNREALETRVAALAGRVEQLEAELAKRTDAHPRTVSQGAVETSPLPQPGDQPAPQQQVEARPPMPVTPLPQPSVQEPAQAPTPEPEEKGVVARLYDFVPDFGW